MDILVNLYYYRTIKSDFYLYNDSFVYVANYLIKENSSIIIVSKEYSDSYETINSMATKAVEQMQQWKNISKAGYQKIIKDNQGVYFIRHRGMFGIYGLMCKNDDLNSGCDGVYIKSKALCEGWHYFLQE